MKRVPFAPLLVISAAAVSACSPPHFLRIELDSSWSSDHGWQVYLRRTDGQEEYVSDTTIDPQFFVDSTLRIQLDKAQGDLLVSFATLGMGKCKTRYHTKTIPIDAASPETTLPLPYIMNDNVPWPPRCNCHMGWCKIESDGSDMSVTYKSISGFRNPNTEGSYSVWILPENKPGIYEINVSSQKVKIPESPTFCGTANEKKFTSIVKANSGNNFLWAIADGKLHRSTIADADGKAGCPQPFTAWPGIETWEPKLGKIVAPAPVPTGNPGEEKIYIAGSVGKDGDAALLHFHDQMTGWLNIFHDPAENPPNPYQGTYINSAWVGKKSNKLVVAVGQNGTMIHRTMDIRNTISIDEEDKTTAELRTVTCIDNLDAPCWAAGANGVIYQIDGLHVSRIRANKLKLATTKHVNQEALLVNGSLSMHLQEKEQQKGKSVAWFVGSHGTVLFYNDSKWYWHQVLEKDEDANTVTYHDIWGADEQNVWIVGTGKRVRIIDPTIPL